MKCPICLRKFKDPTLEVFAYPCGHLTRIDCKRDVFKRAEKEASWLRTRLNLVDIPCHSCKSHCRNEGQQSF